MVGAAPSFSEVHLVRTLLILSGRKTGRKSLVGILGVGEGSVRTILKKLLKDGLITSKPRGQELSRKGRKLVEEYLSKFTMPKSVELDIAPGKKCSIIVMHNSLEKITTGLQEREISVREGADGAVLLKYSNGSISFPCSDISLDDYPGTERFLSELNLTEGDVVVITFADYFEKAVDGELAIALNIISQ